MRTRPAPFALLTALAVAAAAGLRPQGAHDRCLAQGAGQAGAGRPYDITRDPATRKPQIVAAVHKNELYVAWQTWGERGPGERIVVGKTGLDGLADGRLSELRRVASHGALVGFAVDEAGAD